MTDNGHVSRESILSAGRQAEVRHCPDALGGCYVREMSGEDLASFHRWQTEHPDASGIEQQIQILLRSLCDSEGRRLFDPQSENDATELRGCNGTDLYRATRAADALNDVDEQDVETAEGNSDATRS